MTDLRKRKLGATALEPTELGFGALEIGRDWAPDVNASPRHLQQEDAAIMLNNLLDRGLNFIDTAPAYWHSEAFIGEAISNRRHEFILATKVGEHCDPESSWYDYSAAATMSFIDTSLKRLKTDVIDLIQIHSATTEVLGKGETWQALDQARQAGKIRFIGMTGTVEAAIRAVEINGFDTVQIPFNLLDTDASQNLFPLCLEKNIGVIIMRGLAGGKLTRKYRNLDDTDMRKRIGTLESKAQVLYPNSDDSLRRAALRYILSEEAVTTAIVGTRYIESVDKNLTDINEPISHEERFALKRLATEGEA